jgi:hypothetical protein
MDDPATARAAGEAFCLLTGLDVVAAGLDLRPPASVKSSEDPDTASHADDGLPWPSRDGVFAWWLGRDPSIPKDARLILGRPVSAAGCRTALQNGRQRQRIAAALHGKLVQPDRPLFNVCGVRQMERLSGGP